MYIPSGELVIISGVKKYIKIGILKSLRFQIIALIIFVGIVPGLIMRAVILSGYEDRAVQMRTAEIQNQCTILCDQLSGVDYSGGVASEIIQTELTQMTNIYNGRVMLINSEYEIVEDTYDMDVGRTIVSEDVIRCFRGQGTSHYDERNRYIEVTSPILDRSSEEVTGVMLMSVSTDVIADQLAVMQEQTWAAWAAATLVVVLLAIVAGFLMVRPFQRITRSIGAVTEGYEDQYLHENAYTETKLISEAFNKMLGRMKVLNDSRQEFVSNVSHELKTPLTSMKVLADSLLIQEDAPVELYKEFMGDLSEEIERENKIINDLLSLVKLDKTANVMDIKSENINDLVERILKRLRPIAASQNVEVIFESFRPVTAEVDEVKLSLAISNLVENAIKYNKESGWVHVSLNADHKNFYLEVADSGIGIPKEDVEHIFERFYRVDKSHSREIGGTGLGLSIARSAVVMHRGAIKVFSQPGEGTTFTIRIPLTYVA
ncbi:MAG TPA: cell wall metabolism sensor histidine kinase WalK [Candidatus Dorea gallistercoris]|uniref:histidine kinase n=1 Tax=Candidatus Dorea gallistercoris TaxID=2838542 RepID=A0A9D1RA18_9FIRM|nr:cell wall metabolism sensor histidine kinase WalK [Candidatus Dorea gallistercoris]